MKIAAVDFGDSHTGIAECDKLEMIATPICIIDEKRFEVCADKVAEKITSLGAELVVVGDPVNMNGTRGPRSEKCREFAELLRARLGIPVEMWDERSTTVSAHEIMNELNKRGKKRKAVIDSAAAAIILESYLAYRRNRNVQEKV
ncbi:MAG: Holliday junction resolvase RuvX [Ruminiclostridium sp.]|nr:Holliday junction resolvase RuvX [Ruminiclostridium sp.]